MRNLDLARADDGTVVECPRLTMLRVVAVDPVQPDPLDAESRRWIDQLKADGPDHEGALARLHALLLSAARFEINRRRVTQPHLRGNDLDDLAHQAASDALVSILRKLDDFRGDARFTTWAYKFALLEAAVVLRRRAWQGRELPIADEGWERLVAPDPTPGGQAEGAELFGAVRDAIAEHLTAHQREVLVGCVLNGIPIDVLAERMNTTRGALYKTLHDARRKLRAHLALAGLEPLGGGDD